MKEATLQWYMSLLKYSTTNYQNLKNMIIYYSSPSKHNKVSDMSLFNICQGYSNIWREYLSHFNEETVMVDHPNNEIFIGVFQNGLKAGTSL